MPRIGLLGGMSWKTTALYYQLINQRVNERLGGLHSASLLVRSLDYAEVADAVATEDTDALISVLVNGAQDLKDVKTLVLCANVAHKAADELTRRLDLPILHIADCTAKEVLRNGHSRVGLLGTKAVMEEPFYVERLKSYGLEVRVPDEIFRASADVSIFQELSKEIIPEDARTAWVEAARSLVADQQVDCLILACTELRLVLDESNVEVPTFETTAIHAQAAADFALDGE